MHQCTILIGRKENMLDMVILEIFLTSCDCLAKKWALDPIGKSIAKQSKELEILLKIAIINGA